MRLRCVVSWLLLLPFALAPVHGEDLILTGVYRAEGVALHADKGMPRENVALAALLRGKFDAKSHPASVPEARMANVNQDGALSLSIQIPATDADEECRATWAKGQGLAVSAENIIARWTERPGLSFEFRTDERQRLLVRVETVRSSSGFFGVGGAKTLTATYGFERVHGVLPPLKADARPLRSYTVVHVRMNGQPTRLLLREWRPTPDMLTVWIADGMTGDEIVAIDETAIADLKPNATGSIRWTHLFGDSTRPTPIVLKRRHGRSYREIKTIGTYVRGGHRP